MNETTFENAHRGDRVWDFSLKIWGTVEKINPNNFYPLGVKLDNGRKRNYTYTGIFINFKSRILFWDEVPDPFAPPRPKRLVKKTFEAWISIYPHMNPGFHTSEKLAKDSAGERLITCPHICKDYKVKE